MQSNRQIFRPQKTNKQKQNQTKKGGRYLLGDRVHLSKRMNNSLVRIMFRTPHRRRHNPRLPPKGNNINDIPPRAFHGSDIKPRMKPRR